LIAGELHTLQQSANTVIFNGALSDDAILTGIASALPDKLEVSEIPSAWQMLIKIDENIETRPADSRILTALSLASHSDMWAWFRTQVTEPTWYLTTIPVTSSEDVRLPKMPNDWIFPLFQAVQMPLLINNNINLQATKFFPGLIAPDYQAPASSGPMASRILRHVEGAVSMWLQFRPRPGMSMDTSRAVATFTTIARGAFKSPTFLYLNYIQNGIKRLRSILTEDKIPLTKVPWESLAEELKNHPLSHPDSNEARALDCLKELLWAISGIPSPHSTNMSICYREAVEIGGDAGVRDFTQFMAHAHPMYVSTQVIARFRLTPIILSAPISWQYLKHR